MLYFKEEVKIDEMEEKLKEEESDIKSLLNSFEPPQLYPCILLNRKKVEKANF